VTRLFEKWLVQENITENSSAITCISIASKDLWRRIV
jgi:hypothetical protein